MTINAEKVGGRRGSRWRIAGWVIAVSILLLPFLAMRVTGDVTWDVTDFITFGAMLAMAGGAFELAARGPGGVTYRTAAGVAITAAFLLVWVNLAVGFLGSEDNSANLIFLGVPAVAIIGAIVARFQPAGMARAMCATAAAQVLVGVVGLAAGLGSAGPSGLYEVVIGTSLFATLWLLSAWLFRKDVNKQPSLVAAP